MAANSVFFDEQDMFVIVGPLINRIYPGPRGTYWADIEQHDGKVDTIVLVTDDFGDMVGAFGGARQRAIFAQALH